MSSSKKEPSPVTGEIPATLDFLTKVNSLAVQYLRVKGLFYVVIGLTWLIFRSPSREAGLAWVDFLTSSGVGSIWLGAGLISMIAGFSRVQGVKRVGFFVLIVVPTLLGFYFLMSWVIYLLPFIDSEGYQRGGVTTASYWAFSASAYIMSRIHTFSSMGDESNRGDVE